METRRRHACAGLVRAASAAARLANVVRRAWILRAESLARSNGLLFVRRQIECRATFRAQSLPGAPAALHSRNGLPLSFYDGYRTSTIGCVVEAPGAGRIPANCFARAVSLRSTSRADG